MQIRQEFKSNLWEKLSTLASIKSSSAESLMVTPRFYRLFGWVFASLLAFFWLFYVFWESLFYTSHAPIISEYEADTFHINTTEEIKLEIQSGVEASGIYQDVESESSASQVPNTIIIREDWASQIDVSQPQRLQAEPQPSSVQSKTLWESSPTSQKSESASETESISDESNQSDATLNSDNDSQEFSENWSDDSVESMPMWDWESMDTSMMRWAYPMMEPSASFSIDSSVDFSSEQDFIEQDIEDTSEEVIDEFTLRCDVFGWEVAIRDELRVCMIWDIVCSESDFLEWVCELGQE